MNEPTRASQKTKNSKISHLYSSKYYQDFVENLYYEKGEGEISVFVQPEDRSKLMAVTVIDISTLFQEKRGKAFDLII
jgi:hypothetical protein